MICSGVNRLLGSCQRNPSGSSLLQNPAITVHPIAAVSAQSSNFIPPA
jgi:hypothetical protein